jgi:site-specific DNA recombinase
LFTDTTIRRLLSDPTAKGVFRFNHTTRKGRASNWKLKPRAEWIIVEVEAIVSEDVWSRCQMLLTKGKEPWKPALHLFSGLLWCACGEKMYVSMNTPKYVCRICRQSIVAVDLANIIREVLDDCSCDKVTRRELLHDDVDATTMTELVNVQNATQAWLSGEADRVTAVALEQRIDSKTYHEVIDQLGNRQKQIDASISDLTREIRVRSMEARAGVLEERQERFSDLWPDIPHSIRRRIVGHFVRAIVLKNGEIELNLK